jgi:dynactin complex subunit
VLGIAIKGRNRENNINAILNMRQQSQEDMMRVIAKLINSLGENVLVIEEVRSSEVIGSGKGTNANIIADLEEENEQRKEKIDELQNEVAMLRDKNRSLKSEVDERNREQAAIIELMGR